MLFCQIHSTKIFKILHISGTSILLMNRYKYTLWKKASLTNICLITNNFLIFQFLSLVLISLCTTRNNLAWWTNNWQLSSLFDKKKVSKVNSSKYFAACALILAISITLAITDLTIFWLFFFFFFKSKGFHLGPYFQWFKKNASSYFDILCKHSVIHDFI